MIKHPFDIENNVTMNMINALLKFFSSDIFYAFFQVIY